MSRNLLAKHRTTEFLEWCKGVRIDTREPRGPYQVAQVWHTRQWLSIYDRHDAEEHYTVDRRLEPLVYRWIRERV